ncbi:nuclear transport factor 2 family protein [Inquilinus limosus]|uniref:nuclear transport factor 2 family protein n=1 Tax=Inquilinus limosus TaxID=171674 RepID=UPI003F192B71
MADLNRRSPVDVLDDHLALRQRHEVERDIERNYAPDVVVLTSRGAFRGHDAVRRLQRKLREAIGDAEFEFPTKLIDGPYAFLEWRARVPGKSVEDGADSFVIQDGKIVLQTIHYMIEETMPM